MTENLPLQEEIKAPAKVEHPITEDTKERKKADHQDELGLVANFVYSNDDILHDPRRSMIPVMNHINHGIKSGKYNVFSIIITNLFPLDERQDSRVNFFNEG